MAWINAEQLDEWRWDEALRKHPDTGPHGIAPCIVNEYRRLVREDVVPDQFTVEARAIVAAKFPEAHPANEWALVQVAHEGLRRGMEMARENSK